MQSYARTNIPLFSQLRGEGYSDEDIGCVHDAYELAMHMFTGLFRPSGDTFIDHLVGTASILVSLKVPVELVVAGLIHAAYAHGDFGDREKGASDARRRQVRRVVGKEAEEYVARYAALPWDLKTVPAIRDGLYTFDPLDRDVLLIRLANELEDHLDLGILYCCNAKDRQQSIKRFGPDLADMAEKLGFPSLAEELAEISRNTASGEILIELRNRSNQDRAYLIAAKSCRKRVALAVWHELAHRLSRSRLY